jgi:hypothetical protein
VNGLDLLRAIAGPTTTSPSPFSLLIPILSAYAVQKELRAGELLALQVSDLHCDRNMYVVQDRRRVLSFVARLFLLFLETHPIAAETP